MQWLKAEAARLVWQQSASATASCNTGACLPLSLYSARDSGCMEWLEHILVSTSRHATDKTFSMFHRFCNHHNHDCGGKFAWQVSSKWHWSPSYVYTLRKAEVKTAKRTEMITLFLLSSCPHGWKKNWPWKPDLMGCSKRPVTGFRNFNARVIYNSSGWLPNPSDM